MKQHKKGACAAAFLLAALLGLCRTATRAEEGTYEFMGDVIVHSNLTVGTGTATGLYAVAEGKNTTASGEHSHSEGWNTLAAARASHAEGYFSWAYGGQSAHAEGDETTAYGLYSHSEGSETEAGGIASHAEGNSSVTYGIAAHAEGYSVAGGDYSHAAGHSANANHNNTFVWSDGTSFASTTNRQFSVCATNGIRLLGGPVTIGHFGDISMGNFTNTP